MLPQARRQSPSKRASTPALCSRLLVPPCGRKVNERVEVHAAAAAGVRVKAGGGAPLCSPQGARLPGRLATCSSNTRAINNGVSPPPPYAANSWALSQPSLSLSSSRKLLYSDSVARSENQLRALATGSVCKQGSRSAARRCAVRQLRCRTLQCKHVAHRLAGEHVTDAHVASPARVQCEQKASGGNAAPARRKAVGQRCAAAVDGLSDAEKQHRGGRSWARLPSLPAWVPPRPGTPQAPLGAGCCGQARRPCEGV